MQIFGMEFAPLNIPLERRLQTVSAAFWIILFGLGNPLFYAFTAYLLLFTQTIRYFVLLYILWTYYDRHTPLRGGWTNEKSKLMRRLPLWRYFCDYFPIKWKKTSDIDPSRNYLFCCFPHGVLSAGVFGVVGTDFMGFKEKFPGHDVRVITLSQHFKVPFFRELIMSFGACSADAESLNYLLSTKPPAPCTGRITVLIVGGASEALESRPGVYRILVKRRKGFVRMALKYGTPLVPVFAFGETDIYDQPDTSEGSKLRTFQKYMQKMTGYVPLILMGRGFFQYNFGIIPHRRPLTVVVGSPMEVPTIAEPTAEDVKKYHEKFTNELVALFEEYKHRYIENAGNVTLEFLV